LQLKMADCALPFQPFIVQHEAFDDILIQALRGPAAKLQAPVAAHPVAYSQNHVQVVEVHQPLDLATAFGLN